MAQLTYPGVYIEEVPSGVRAITAVSTSIAAFVDRFRRGPEDKPVQVFGMADVERIFGGVVAYSPASYGLAQFFLNGGSTAWVVRVENGTVTTASLQLNDAAANHVVTLTMRDAGAWANQLVRVQVGVSDPTGAFDVVITQYGDITGAATPVSEERYRVSSTAQLVAQINAGSALVTAAPTATAASPAPNGLIVTPTMPAGAVPATFNVVITPPVGSTRTVPCTMLTPAPTTLELTRLRIEEAIRNAGRDRAEPSLVGARVVAIAGGTRWHIVTGRSAFEPGARLNLTGAAAVSLGIDNVPPLTGVGSSLNNPQEYVVGAPLAWGALGAQRASTPGIDGGALTSADIIGNTTPVKTGMQALRDVDLFNLLCLPALAELRTAIGTPDDTAIGGAYALALQFCVERRAMLLVDPPRPPVAPEPPPPGGFLEYATGLPARFSQLNSPNAAWYVPRISIADPANDFEPITVATSGTIAGIMARTDAAAGPWLAPAGVEAVLRGVVGLEYKLGDGENGVLNQQGTNCLRSFPVQGRIVWGARTRRGADELADEWKYIPIRRLALMIEESLFRGTKWAVFQPNDEPLWARLRQNVGAFMHRLFRQGAFQGATPREAYFVRCDRQTNPPENRDLGIVTVEVGFAPLKPAEFVVIRIQQIAELTA